MRLEAQEVQNVLEACLSSEPANKPGVTKIVEGIRNKFAFDIAALEKHRETINDMLDELPPEFHEDTGGGMSFLQACMDRHGRHWGEHMTMDHLFALGMGIDRVVYPLPRDVWSVLPGSVPYVTIRRREKASA